MRKRSIVVPKDEAAAKEVNYGEFCSDHLLEMDLSESDFLYLEQFGVIDQINAIAGTVIGDFEEDWVLDRENLIRILQELQYYNNNSFNSEHRRLLERLMKMFEEGLERGTGIYFFT
jgi:hypothetical protein